jgi:heme exporter protein A
MSSYLLKAVSLTKTFGRRLIFNGLNFELNNSLSARQAGTIFGIAGPNGSGKSTLVKIIAGIISPSGGKIEHHLNGKEIKPEELHNHIGLVSPYLVLYDEFTAWENLDFFAKIRGIKLNNERVNQLLDNFAIYDRRNDLVKTYSSGMKQRLKFVFALMHSPNLLILDEPTSNLDDEGKEAVYKMIKEEGENNIIIIASNENADLTLCGNRILLGENKRSKVKSQKSKIPSETGLDNKD